MDRPSLIVTDLDGTLWHTDDHVPEATVTALHQLLDGDVPVLVATGRRATSTRVPLARIGVAPPAIVLNGALGLDLASGERFHCSPFPPEQAVAVLDAFRAADLDPCLYVDHPQVEVWLSDTPSTNPEHVDDLRPSARFGDLDRVAAEERVLGFSIIGIPHGALTEAATKIGDTAEVHLDRSLDFPGMAAMTVAPLGQSKWDGVVAFCCLHDLDSDRVLAMGDGPNDVELLTGAALALVPEVAHPAALEVADRVIPAAADGGWAAVLELL